MYGKYIRKYNVRECDTVMSVCPSITTDFEAATPPEVVVVHVTPHDVDGTVALPTDEHARMGDTLEGYVRSVSPQAGHHLKCYKIAQKGQFQFQNRLL